MSVAQQKKILENMQKKQYHIVVATAVAEEGIDIPECELVITFNPPSTVTALVQMRGRARKNHSKFIILCNSSKEKVETFLVQYHWWNHVQRLPQHLVVIFQLHHGNSTCF
jgi:ERCC4-related helicase